MPAAALALQPPGLASVLSRIEEVLSQAVDVLIAVMRTPAPKPQSPPPREARLAATQLIRLANSLGILRPDHLRPDRLPSAATRHTPPPSATPQPALREQPPAPQPARTTSTDLPRTAAPVPAPPADPLQITRRPGRPPAALSLLSRCGTA